MTKSKVSTEDLINTHLDCILIWSNNDHADKKVKIAEQVEMIRKVVKNSIMVPSTIN